MLGCGIESMSVKTRINSLLRKEAAVSTKLLRTVRKSSAFTSGMRSEYENTTSDRPSRFLVVARQPPRVSPGKKQKQVSAVIY
jgi:hypothetical protein